VDALSVRAAGWPRSHRDPTGAGVTRHRDAHGVDGQHRAPARLCRDRAPGAGGWLPERRSRDGPRAVVAVSPRPVER
jgi:hypothetical protein